MTRPDTLPTALADALDKPLVGPVALILLGGLVVLAAAWLIDRAVNRGLERHRLHAKIAAPEFTEASDFERSPFVKVSPGIYAIRPDSDLAAQLRASVVDLECELTGEEVEAWLESREGSQ